MTVKTRKLIGTVVLLVFLAAYALVVAPDASPRPRRLHSSPILSSLVLPGWCRRAC